MLLSKNASQPPYSATQRKNFEDISITELVKKADVGRTSFYRNFECKKLLRN